MTDLNGNHKVPDEKDTFQEKSSDRVRHLAKPLLCTLVICIGSFAFGTAIAWPSPAIPDLNGHLNPFFITTDQNSWIGSILTLGALFGAIIGGPYADKVGRKLGLMSFQVVFAVGWIIIAASSNFGCLMAGRAITGLGVGAVSVTCPIYISEIAPADIRGLLGSCHQLFIVSGNFFIFVFGLFTPWNWLAFYALTFNLILTIAICFVPESPRWLLSIGQKESAESALKWLRGAHCDVTSELACLQQNIAESQERASIRDFARPELWKPLVICFFLMLCQQFCGMNVILTYSVEIFQMTGSDLDPDVQSVAVTAVGIVGTLVSVFVLDLVGRRILLTLSAVVMSLTIAGMGTFFYEQYLDADYAANKLSWLPLVCLIVFNFGFNCAYGPVPWLMVGELFPQKARGIAGAFAIVFSWLFAFLLTQFFNDMSDAMGVYGAYWFCGAFCVFAIPFSAIFVPETKGKTLEQIQESFK